MNVVLFGMVDDEWATTVSVIVPIWNRAGRMLRAAIDSILGQTAPPAEVMVIDDGSDDTVESVASVVAEYGGAVQLHRQERGGIGVARNTGIVMTTGSMLAFLDSDDLWLPKKLERQLAAFDADPVLEAAFVHGEQFYDVDADAAFRQRHPIKDPVLAAWTSPSMLIRRVALDRVGPYRAGTGAGVDVDWWARSVDAGLAHVMLDDVLYRRRVHAGNNGLVTANPATDRIRALKRSLDRRRAAASGADSTDPPET